MEGTDLFTSVYQLFAYVIVPWYLVYIGVTN